MSFREIDGKRDQFRKYIESKGVIDGITKVLTKLLEMPEKPEHPMDFIRANLGASQAEEKRIASLEKEVDDYKKEVSELKSQLEAVKAKLGEYEKPTDVKEADEPKKDEKSDSSTVQSTETKESDNKQSNVGGAEADAVKDKNVAESEKAATPSTTAAPVDSAKVSTDSENAEVAKTNTADPKKDDEKPAASTTTEADKAKPDGSDTTTSTDKDK